MMQLVENFFDHYRNPSQAAGTQPLFEDFPVLKNIGEK
jgi:hypothetical protein